MACNSRRLDLTKKLALFKNKARIISYKIVVGFLQAMASFLIYLPGLNCESPAPRKPTHFDNCRTLFKMVENLEKVSDAVYVDDHLEVQNRESSASRKPTFSRNSTTAEPFSKSWFMSQGVSASRLLLGPPERKRYRYPIRNQLAHHAAVFRELFADTSTSSSVTPMRLLPVESAS